MRIDSRIALTLGKQSSTMQYFSSFPCGMNGFDCIFWGAAVHPDLGIIPGNHTRRTGERFARWDTGEDSFTSWLATSCYRSNRKYCTCKRWQESRRHNSTLSRQKTDMKMPWDLQVFKRNYQQSGVKIPMHVFGSKRIHKSHVPKKSTYSNPWRIYFGKNRVSMETGELQSNADIQPVEVITDRHRQPFVIFCHC